MLLVDELGVRTHARRRDRLEAPLLDGRDDLRVPARKPRLPRELDVRYLACRVEAVANSGHHRSLLRASELLLLIIVGGNVDVAFRPA